MELVSIAGWVMFRVFASPAWGLDVSDALALAKTTSMEIKNPIGDPYAPLASSNHDGLNLL